jgi:hypothetical protein
MHSLRSGRAMLLWGVATCLSTAACGSSSDAGSDVELQVIGGFQGNIPAGLNIRVTTPHDTERRPYPVFGAVDGDRDWVKLHIPLNDGDVVEFAAERSSGAVDVSGTCIVRGAREGGYARAFVSLATFVPGRYVNCDQGFDSDGY